MTFRELLSKLRLWRRVSALEVVVALHEDRLAKKPEPVERGESCIGFYKTGTPGASEDLEP